MRFIMLTIIIAFLASGCSMNRTVTDQEKNAQELDPTKNHLSKEDPEWDSRLGYVHYTRGQVANQKKQEISSFDRNQLADQIARLVLQNSGFEQVAALVTDREVLIAYQKNERLTDEQAADIAKQTAYTLLPRFFEVYVSHNENHIRSIHSLHLSTTNDSIDNQTLQQIIVEMKRYPQGLDKTKTE
ncbi:YhcN/YlaJ family sporulation lipoprotein [Ornithinibacillus gellani]|uniref:YhcN/YlaJ family sporulation lipoprotein n=1 Tax=Ornithinibacillus gellani TaxID=2293253 RepID=UPI001680BAF8|nr:YhcN/YlaJ family sporulation lipoprotein [Ornithinibacillus gellani]